MPVTIKYKSKLETISAGILGTTMKDVLAKNANKMTGGKVKAAVKPVSKKPKAAKTSKKANSHEAVKEELQIQADIVGSLQKEKELAAVIAKTATAAYNKAAIQVQELYGKIAETADDTLIVKGDLYVIEIGKEGTAREIVSADLAYEALDEVKAGLACQLMQFKLSDLDKYLTPEQMTELIDTVRTGKRTVKSHPIT